MSTRTIRLRSGSRWCRALIPVQPGLPAATNCPFSVRRWTGGRGRDTEGGDRERVCGLKRIGRGIEGKEERGEDRRDAWCASCLETALTHMLLISRGERGG